jgi:hypothetical protein
MAVADPSALRRYYDQHIFGGRGRDYWSFLPGINVSMPEVCDTPPGLGPEGDGGYRILREKIRVATSYPLLHRPKVLCALYSYEQQHDRAVTAAWTWGHECDGFLIFSNASSPIIPSMWVSSLEYGEESYFNMWQKVRHIWYYIHSHYRRQYDFFHLGGDDMYVIVDNLRYLLSSQYSSQLTLAQTRHNGSDSRTTISTRKEVQDYFPYPVFLGQWIRQKNGYYIGGGPGYTLNGVALDRFVTDLFPSCFHDKRASYEDRLLSWCFRSIGIVGNDTRDVNTGEQTYHDCSPQSLYYSNGTNRRRPSFHDRNTIYWQSLPMPLNSTINVGQKMGLQAAATYSVSLHKIAPPSFMARIHAILFPALVCVESTTI